MTPTERFLHDLVRRGIGGATVAQARRNLSTVEFARWLMYADDVRSERIAILNRKQTPVDW